jgi:hypothetical protein
VILGSFLPGIVGAVAGSVSQNEASTTLLLIDNRSGVQISASEGTAKNFDFGVFGAAWAGLGAAGGGYSNTPQGKVVVAAFADSYNQMVKSLRNYKAQTVKGGLGTGGRLGVQGGQTPASQEINKKEVMAAALRPAPAPRCWRWDRRGPGADLSPVPQVQGRGAGAGQVTRGARRLRTARQQHDGADPALERAARG